MKNQNDSTLFSIKKISIFITSLGVFFIICLGCAISFWLITDTIKEKALTNDIPVKGNQIMMLMEKEITLLDLYAQSANKANLSKALTSPDNGLSNSNLLEHLRHANHNLSLAAAERKSELYKAQVRSGVLLKNKIYEFSPETGKLSNSRAKGIFHQAASLKNDKNYFFDQNNGLVLFERIANPANNKTAGIYFTQIKNFKLTPHLEGKLSEGDWVYLLDKKGTVLYIFAQDTRGLWNLAQERSLFLGKHYSKVTGSGIYYDKVLNASSFTHQFSIQGDDRFMNSKKLNNGWHIVVSSSVDETISKVSLSLLSTIGLQFFLLLLFILFAYFLIGRLTKNIDLIILQAKKISSGDISNLEELRIESKALELHQLKNAFSRLASSFQQMSQFAKEIGEANFENEYHFEKKNVLGNALNKMKSSLVSYQEKERKEKWIAQGVADFSDKLRKNTNDLQLLAQTTLCDLIKHLGANQGAIFTAEERPDGSVYLKQQACYAYERIKHQEQEIEIGEGLVGQAYLEKDKIYLTEVPDDYLKITSGLGEALPENVLIMPFLIDEEVLGVLELASFSILEEHQIRFVEKISEALAGTISYSKITQRTQKLLEESQLKTQMLAEQEEELRQNMEELLTTQEQLRNNG